MRWVLPSDLSCSLVSTASSEHQSPAVLDVQMKRASREETGPSQEALLELCRSDPSVLNVIEPFLTDQMDWVMGEVADGQDGSV